jgi:hypothetical protein
MADRFIKVLNPATSYEILSLDEAKLMLGISKTDHSQDEQLQFFTDVNSAIVMRKCHRIFARERIQESWTDVPSGRVFLSHWPVSENDIESVSFGGSGGYMIYNANFAVEEASGKVYVGSVTEPITIVYTGGYDLPTEAPLPLKQAVGLLNKQSYLTSKIGASGGALASGVRMLAHRDSRVMYHDPAKILQAQNMLATAGAKGAGIDDALDAILYHYMKIEV